MSIFRTKPLRQIISESQEQGEHSLRKALSSTNLTLLGLAGIVGAGVYSLLAQTAGQHAGPAVSISFLLAALACGFTGLCYAELASMLPVAGSAYTYAYASMGELLAWVLGWDLFLEYAVGAGTAAASFSHVLRSTVDQVNRSTPHSFDLPAASIILVISLILAIGVKESAQFGGIVTFIKILVILIFVLLGISRISLAHFRPFIPPNTGVQGEFGISGVLRGAGILYFAYIGFDVIGATAQEVKSPGKDIPIAMGATLIVSTVLYLGFALVLVGCVPLSLLGSDTSLTNAYHLIFSPPVAYVLSWGTMIGLASAALSMVLGQTRILYSMANDGLLPPILAKIHPRYRTPVAATCFGAVFTALAAGFIPLRLLAELTSIGTLLAFAIVCVAIMVLRKTSPDRCRPFRAPWVPFVPIMGILLNALIMAYLSSLTWLRFAGWLTLGLVFYFAYARRHSRLNNLQESA